MASAQVDLSEGCVGLTRDQFRRLTKEQLISLAGVEEIELAKDIRKPAIVAYLTRELNLEELWLKQQGQATLLFLSLECSLLLLFQPHLLQV